ncbi:hypothetical protein, partial [Geminicoccus harenae]
RAAIAEFRDVLKLTTTPRRLTNPSGSGAYVERAMRQMTSRMASATLGATVGPGAGLAMEAGQAVAAGSAGRRAAKAAVGEWAVRPTPLPVIGASGAAAASSGQDR